MSGHSKWSTIKHQKGVADKRRGLAFSKTVKLITLAVKEGGSSDPDANFKLRLAMEKAKEVNMPKDNIQRAIDRAGGAGGQDSVLTRAVYEGFGPSQTAIMVECVTDNTNRTVSEIKSYFDKRGGSFVSSGSVSYLFDQKGRLLVKKSGNDENDQLKLMDFNPEDIIDRGLHFVLITASKDLARLRQDLVKAGFEVEGAEMVFVPKSKVRVDDEKKKENLVLFVQGLEELEDVEAVYINTDLD